MTYNFDRTENPIADKLEKLKYVDENGNEYWFARDFVRIFKYDTYSGITRALRKAVVNLLNDGETPASLSKHFQYAPEPNSNPETTYFDENFKLSCFACYHLAKGICSSRPNVDKVTSFFSEKVEKEKLSFTEEPKVSADANSEKEVSTKSQSSEEFDARFDSLFAEFRSQISDLLETLIRQEFDRKLSQISQRQLNQETASDATELDYIYEDKSSFNSDAIEHKNGKVEFESFSTNHIGDADGDWNHFDGDLF